eukprot:SRR837773.11324.p1 GENE.SRR837773.11324~~SRR837773.11324.p1  ORF type:complete len:321 (-),score=67.10 SRR837773.11324:166-1002(-)
MWGPIYGCQAFVPAMKASGKPGLIVNTGSKQGITMPPGNLAYNVSKAALKAYTEGLEHELRSEAGSKLSAALLVPGWTNTSIVMKSKREAARAAGEDFSIEQAPFHEGKPAGGAWMPKQVVDFMLAELEKGRFYIMCPDNDVDRETDNLRMTWAMGRARQTPSCLVAWTVGFVLGARAWTATVPCSRTKRWASRSRTTRWGHMRESCGKQTSSCSASALGVPGHGCHRFIRWRGAPQWRCSQPRGHSRPCQPQAMHLPRVWRRKVCGGAYREHRRSQC